VVQAGVGVRNADVLGLSAVNQVAQDPAAVAAVRVHADLAVVAAAARGNAGDEHPVARLEVGYGLADFFDDADAFMPEGAPIRHRRHVTRQNVQIGAANGGVRDANDGIRGLLNRRAGLVRPFLLPRTPEDQRLHDGRTSFAFLFAQIVRKHRSPRLGTGTLNKHTYSLSSARTNSLSSARTNRKREEPPFSPQRQEPASIPGNDQGKR